MSNVLFIANVGFEMVATSFEDEGFDLVVFVGVDKGGKVFGVALGVEEGGEGGGCAEVGGVVGYVDCACLLKLFWDGG